MENESDKSIFFEKLVLNKIIDASVLASIISRLALVVLVIGLIFKTSGQVWGVSILGIFFFTIIFYPYIKRNTYEIVFDGEMFKSVSRNLYRMKYRDRFYRASDISFFSVWTNFFGSGVILHFKDRSYFKFKLSGSRRANPCYQIIEGPQKLIDLYIKLFNEDLKSAFETRVSSQIFTEPIIQYLNESGVKRKDVYY